MADLKLGAKDPVVIIGRAGPPARAWTVLPHMEPVAMVYRNMRNGKIEVAYRASGIPTADEAERIMAEARNHLLASVLRRSRTLWLSLRRRR